MELHQDSQDHLTVLFCILSKCKVVTKLQGSMEKLMNRLDEFMHTIMQGAKQTF